MAASEAARNDLHGRFAKLRAHLADPDFLGNRGLGNEVGIYTLCYDPALEIEVRDLVTRLKSDDLPARIVERSRACTAAQTANLCPANTSASRIAATPREYGDVILITGVGEVFPFLRLHDLFDSIQPLVGDVPIVALYPGRFDGRNLQLFSRLEEEHYYRAFDLV